MSNMIRGLLIGKALLAITILAGCSESPQLDQTGDANVMATQEREMSSPSATVARSPASVMATAASKTIACHELLGGKPSPEATTYQLIGSDFYRKSPGRERLLISSQGRLVPLGRTEDDRGPQDSFASHTLQGDVLTRTVLWQRLGEAPRTAFVDRYDFRKQTVLDDKGEDSCYYNGFSNGRTQP